MKPILFAISLVLALSDCSPAAMIVVPVSLTWQGTTVQVEMAVDTGAATTTIGSELAARLGIPRGGQHGGVAELADGRRVRYQTVTMDVAAGDMVRPGLDVNIMEYGGSRSVDGWLGNNFLADMTLTIDWKNRRLYWSR